MVSGYDGRISIKKLVRTAYGKYTLEPALTYKCHHEKTNRKSLLFQLNDCGFLNRNKQNSNVIYTVGGNGNIITWDIRKKVKIREISTGGKINFKKN